MLHTFTCQWAVLVWSKVWIAPHFRLEAGMHAVEHVCQKCGDQVSRLSVDCGSVKHSLLQPESPNAWKSLTRRNYIIFNTSSHIVTKIKRICTVSCFCEPD